MTDDTGAAAVHLCPRCARESVGDFRFCPYCGAMLEALAAPLLERRRVVVLFCDLVASTSLAAGRDPEQVQTTLSAYHRAVRARIESYGGTVEKFVGDAVMAVFGAPHAHEDDAERAVGAALDVLADVAAQRAPDGAALQARIGVHLGETAVTVTADVSGGEAYVAGEVVNTAARLQTVADPGTAVVSAAVAEAAAARFELVECEPRAVKGLVDPLEHWRVVGPSRRSLPARMPDLVDRAVELPLLEGLLAEVVEERRARLVSISGSPGMGKSRLVHELSRRAAQRDEAIVWLTGGCLPYGDGITFWALAEVLKELAGVLDSDAADVVRERVEALLPGDGEAAWLRARLLPLLGVDSTPVERHELFSAWTRALALAAEATPTVVVLEDLHWADPAMLDFVEHVHAQDLDVPLLVILTFRSQLLSRRPTWAGWTSPSLELSSLTAEETEQLMTADLDATELAPETMAAFLERADGNPLFAQEFARLLRDREAAGRSGPGADASMPVPTSVHALVGARLDVLSLSERAVVRDASVVGRVFWSGAVAAMSDQSAEVVERVLDSLVDKGVVLAHEVSSMGGEREYSFGHAVVRDVAYERASRSRRLEAHLAAMAWIEQATEGRVDEVAEVLVHHASTALDLAELSDAPDEQRLARAATRRYAVAAARRALGLDPARALMLVDLARGLGDDDLAEDPEVLLLWGRAALFAGRIREAREPMQLCVDSLRQAGRWEELVDALVVLGNVCYQLGDTADGLAADRESVEVARSSAPARLGFARSNLAMTYAALADPAGLELADEEVARAEAEGAEPPMLALRARATLRLMAGDARGLEDHDRATELLARAGTSPMALAYAMNGRVEGVWAVRGPVEAVAAADETIAFMRARGAGNSARWTEVNRLQPLLETGRLRACANAAGLLFDQLDEEGSLAASEAMTALVAAADELDDDLPLAQRALRLRALSGAAFDVDDAEETVLRLLPGVLLDLREGRRTDATASLRTVAARPDLLAVPSYGHLLTTFVRAALRCDDVETAAVLGTPDRADTTLRHLAQTTAAAYVAAARGQHASALPLLDAAARRWDEVGNLVEAWHVGVRRAACLAELGDPGAARAAADADALRARLLDARSDRDAVRSP